MTQFFRRSVEAVTLQRLRATAVALLCLAATAIFLAVLDESYKVKDWLVWPIGTLWCWCALFNAACLCFGHALLVRVFRLNTLPALETLVLSMAVGTVGFVLAMYVAGALQLYGPWFATILPALMIASGGRRFLRFAREALASNRAGSMGLIAALAFAAGSFCVGLLYLQSMTPTAINYDARWYHLTVAQDYALAGGIVPFLAEYTKAFPHLSSVVHAWGWLVPGLSEPQHWMMVLHQEFSFVLWTLAGVGAGVSWLVEQPHVKGAWAAFFLFPAIFVYDCNIGGSADHVLGFFAVPLFLAVLRAGEELEPRRCALVGVIAAGALLTKYQSIYLIAPAGLWLSLRLVWLRFRSRRLPPKQRARLWIGPLTVVVVGALLSSPHFLKNWFFYGNPMFPFMQKTFTSTWPQQPESAALVEQMFTDDSFKPKGGILKLLKNALETSFTFSFRTQYMPTTRPVLGSLFTLLLPATLFFRSPRLWAGAFLAMGAVLTWSYTYVISRYTQAFTPLLAAVTGALIVRIWALGRIARLGLVPLVATQVIWGGDALFYSGQERLNDAISLIRSGFDGKAETRFDHYFSEQVAIDKRLPEDAVLLLHNTRLTLGIRRKTLQDIPGFQGLISYRDLKTPRDLGLKYRGLGITHVIHERGVWPAFSKQEEAIFAVFLQRHAINVFRQGGYEIFELPAAVPPPETSYRVLSLGLGRYQDGIYPVEAMNVIDPLPERFRQYPPPQQALEPQAALGVLGTVEVTFIGAGLSVPDDLSRALARDFDVVMAYGNQFAVHVRKTPLSR